MSLFLSFNTYSFVIIDEKKVIIMNYSTVFMFLKYGINRNITKHKCELIQSRIELSDLQLAILTISTQISQAKGTWPNIMYDGKMLSLHIPSYIAKVIKIIIITCFTIHINREKGDHIANLILSRTNDKSVKIRDFLPCQMSVTSHIITVHQHELYKEKKSKEKFSSAHIAMNARI